MGCSKLDAAKQRWKLKGMCELGLCTSCGTETNCYTTCDECHWLCKVARAAIVGLEKQLKVETAKLKGT